jgi:hypothetical protein
LSFKTAPNRLSLKPHPGPNARRKRAYLKRGRLFGYMIVVNAYETKHHNIVVIFRSVNIDNETIALFDLT